MDILFRSHGKEPIQNLSESYTIQTKAMDTTHRSHEEKTNTGSK